MSVTLFDIAIDGIVAAAGNAVRTALYVGYFEFFNASPRIAVAERRLQLAVDRIANWAGKNRFRVSLSKAQAMHCCR